MRRFERAWWVIIAAVVLRVPLLFVGLTYRIDIWRQTDTASIARNFTSDANLFFPRINWGGAGPGFVEAELQLFPWTVSWLYRLFGDHVWLGRGLALVCSTVTLVVFWNLAQRVVGRRAALVALVCLAASPVFIRYSVAFMPEPLALMAYVLALWYFDRWVEEHTWSLALRCGAAAAVAGLVKPTTLHLAIVFAIVLVVVRGWRSLLSSQALALAAIVAVPVSAWLWHAAGLHADYGNTFGVISGGDRKFGGLGYWTSTAFYSGSLRIDAEWVFAWVGVLPAIIGVVVALRRRGPVLLLAGLVALVVYYFTAARYISADFGAQYHVYTAVFGALAVGLGVEWALIRAAGRSGSGRALVEVGVAALTVFALITVATAYLDHFRDRGQEAVNCGRAVNEVVPAADLVIIASTSLAVDHGVPNNFEDPTIFYFADRRGWSLAADRQEPVLVESEMRQGARWLITSQHLLDEHPELAGLLAASARLESAGAYQTGMECLIYRLGSS